MYCYFLFQGMALPEPTTIEPLEKKIPQRYANNDLIIDFLQVWLIFCIMKEACYDILEEVIQSFVLQSFFSPSKTIRRFRTRDLCFRSLVHELLYQTVVCFIQKGLCPLCRLHTQSNCYKLSSLTQHQAEQEHNELNYFHWEHPYCYRFIVK